jgi:hypothetical protein
MSTWQYHVEQFQMIERWRGSKQAEEFARFEARMNQLGGDGWEMIGYAPIPTKGAFTDNKRATLHVCFFKRQTG